MKPVRLKPAVFSGRVHEPGNLSAAAVAGDFLVLGSDEGNRVQVLKRSGRCYEVVHDVPLNDDGGGVDVAGIACEKKVRMLRPSSSITASLTILGSAPFSP